MERVWTLNMGMHSLGVLLGKFDYDILGFNA